MSDLAGVRAVACDIFGTTVDWRTGVARQTDELLRPLGVDLHGGALADEWRERYLPSMRAVNDGGDWHYLDDLHRAAYLTATALLDLRPDQVLMVAAHHWDIDGARSAGLRTAFLERPGEKGPDHNADRAAESNADLVVDDFPDLARRLRSA